jgi:predicted homoserine dehydrogenase-like protein
MNSPQETSLSERLSARGPIRVAVVGAGTSGAMIIRHLMSRVVPALRLVAVANRTVRRTAALMETELGYPPAEVSTAHDLELALERGVPALCSDAELLCSSDKVEVVVEATGTVEFGATVVCKAIQHHKHVVLVNAELDATLGPLLKTYADTQGVVYSHTDGEEPGVAMTLVRYLRSIGLRPVAAGNLKGMIDPYRTPETQREFAVKHNQDPAKVASFADGTKLSMEATILANATGFQVGKRGMYGPSCLHVREIARLLPLEQMLAGGLVDYALGAEPYTGVFVIVHEEHPIKRRELNYFKMGEGPLYVFYTPYHLPHIQIASSIIHAALEHDSTVAPLGPPICEVATLAKRPLRAGEILDGVGGFMAYGVIENADLFRSEGLLPIGVSEGCRLVRNVAKDEAVRYSDVELPEGRLCDRLRAEQAVRFGPRKSVIGAHMA